METINKCILCQLEVRESYYDSTLDTAKINCIRCGQFEIANEICIEIGTVRVADFHIYAGAIRELNERDQIPRIDKFETLTSLVRVPQDPIAKMDRILLSLQRTLPKAGETKEFIEIDYPIGYAHDHNEFAFLIRKMKEAGFFYDTGAGGLGCQIDTIGWRRLRELSVDAYKSNQAFVAMRFHTDTEAAWTDGILPALETTGYDAFRVDRKEHDEKIDDLIISEIRKSGLMVADFTQQSQGVYFEAGFAMGLGIHVIRCCKDDDNEVKQLHFDTRQYNHILWKDPADLQTKLITRINAWAPKKKDKTS